MPTGFEVNLQTGDIMWDGGKPKFAGVELFDIYHLIDTQSATGTPSITFSTGIDTTYEHYLLLVRELQTSVSTELRLRTLDSLGAVNSGASDYQYNVATAASNSNSVSVTRDTADDHIVLVIETPTASDETITGAVDIFRPSSEDMKINIEGKFLAPDSGGNITGNTIVALAMAGSEDMSGVEISTLSGNITAGQVFLIGVDV